MMNYVWWEMGYLVGQVFCVYNQSRQKNSWSYGVGKFYVHGRVSLDVIPSNCIKKMVGGFGRELVSSCELV